MAHFASYLALGYSLTRASGSPIFGLLVAAWFGAFDEVHQAFVPGRDAGITDWWFDLLGGFVGAGLAFRSLRRSLVQASLDVPHIDDTFE